MTSMSSIAGGVINFVVPPDDSTKLYVTLTENASHQWNTDYKTLYELFSRFGLLHELYLHYDPLYGPTSNVVQWAIVSYYLKHEAEKARSRLHEHCRMCGTTLSIRFYRNKRKIESELSPRKQKQDGVYYMKAWQGIRLMRHYLGFHNVSIQLKSWRIVEQVSPNELDKSLHHSALETWHCHVVLIVTNNSIEHRLDGIAQVNMSHPELAYIRLQTEQNTSKMDDSELAVNIRSRVRVASYEFAVRDAFAQIRMVVLEDGHVALEIKDKHNHNQTFGMNIADWLLTNSDDEGEQDGSIDPGQGDVAKKVPKYNTLWEGAEVSLVDFEPDIAENDNQGEESD
eukprot:m.73395 g.73395  ORF g.73395 m.73395 type:complete len:341 (-) comp12408_c0_seq1:113-1135(-)